MEKDPMFSHLTEKKPVANDCIRVAQIMGKMNGGGVEAVVMNYYRHIDRSKVQFDFLIDEDSTFVPYEEIELLGGRVFFIPPYQHATRYSRYLEKLFSEQDWKIVHSHVNALSVFPLRAAKRANIPVRIAHSHSTSGEGEYVKNLIKYLLRTQANRYPTHRFACSRYAGGWLFGKEARFEVVYNAIDLSRFAFNVDTRTSVRTSLGLTDNHFVVGHVGRFTTQKNHAFLIDTFAELKKKCGDAVLLLVGEGELRSFVAHRAAERGVADKVIFLGQRDDVDRFYQAFDAFVLPSLYEGLGIVGIEAQRAGLPCLLSDRITREVDVTKKVEFLPIDDSKAWVEALISLKSGQRLDTSSEAFANYDIERTADKLVESYIRLLSESSVETVVSFQLTKDQATSI